MLKALPCMGDYPCSQAFPPSRFVDRRGEGTNIENELEALPCSFCSKCWSLNVHKAKNVLLLVQKAGVWGHPPLVRFRCYEIASDVIFGSKHTVLLPDKNIFTALVHTVLDSMPESLRLQILWEH